MMNFRYVRFLRNTYLPVYELKAKYSRKNNSNLENFYEVFAKVDNEANHHKDSTLAPIPNWELLKPRGYRFFLPGSVGPGWHDMRSNPHSLFQDFDLENSDLKCYAQDCPVLLRQTVSELFTGIDFSYSRLTVISLSQKTLKPIFELEEDLMKIFVLAAQDICQKLRNSGCWADFINPFSGLPGFSTYNVKNVLYTTDPRFRSIGFRITERHNCRIIEDKKSCRFQGSLFTTAAADAEVVRKILLPTGKSK